MNGCLASSRLARLMPALAAAAALALGAAQAAAGGSSAATFNDPAGDAGDAPDVTAIKVTDDASGRITFRIATPGTTDLGDDQFLMLRIDADADPATGSHGADYLFAIYPDESYAFARWNGSDWDWTIPYGSVRVEWDEGATISIDRNELGGTTAFAFDVATETGDGWQVGHSDFAPDDPAGAGYAYTLTGGTAGGPAPAPRPATIASLVLVPGSLAPIAGRTFRFAVGSARLGSGAVVAPSAVACTATLDGKAVKGTGKGGCTLLLAKASRGKKLVVTVTVTYGTAPAYRRSYTLTVR